MLGSWPKGLGRYPVRKTAVAFLLTAAGKAEKGRRAVKASQQDVQRPWGAFTSRSTLCVTGINLDTGVGGRVGGGAPARSCPRIFSAVQRAEEMGGKSQCT